MEAPDRYEIRYHPSIPADKLRQWDEQSWALEWMLARNPEHESTYETEHGRRLLPMVGAGAEYEIDKPNRIVTVVQVILRSIRS